MKILNIIAQKPYATGSGVYMTEVMKAFHRLGHQQRMICGVQQNDPSFGEYQKDFPYLAINPLVYGSRHLPFLIPGMSDVMPYPSTLYKHMTSTQSKQLENEFMAILDQEISEFEPDIILCHHLYFLTALTVERLKGRKLGGVCHGTCLRQLGSSDFERERIIQGIHKLPYIFALQKEQKEEICRLFSGEESRIELVGNGYNPSVFWKCSKDCSPKNLSAVNSEGKRIFKMIYAGKIAENKGVMSLLRAVNKIEAKDMEIQLFLAGGSGDFVEFDRIEKMCSSCKHPVHLLGHLSQEALSQYYRESDLFVFPSYYEGLGLAPIEAMACGLPAVISNTTGIKDHLLEHLEKPPVVFVDLPTMEDLDKPVAEELPDFENRLKEGIEQQIHRINQGEWREPFSMDSLSWDGVASKILNFFEK